MRSSSLLVVAFSLVVAVGCDTPTAPAIPEAPASATPEPLDAIDTTGVALPSSLTCVSAPLGDGTDVLRVQVAVAADGGTVTLQRGPQFWSHNGVWTSEVGEVDTRAVQVVDGRVTETGRMGLDLGLAREGNVFRGTLVDDQCYQRLETQLTCWNDLELFGSPWAGVPGALDATFDWASGACLDREGHPALNEVPIEVVRETGQGACADLRGMALNGADYTGPDLVGWNLVGARLNGASLFFAQLDYASLNGAKLSDLNFGYATITGSIDDHTELPDACETQESPWSGAQASCVQ